MSTVALPTSIKAFRDREPRLNAWLIVGLHTDIVVDLMLHLANITV